MSLTHEERMELARQLNAEWAAAKKSGTIATRDLIRADSITSDEAAELVALYPEWGVGTAYAVGELVAYQCTLYQCIQPHTSLADWTPDIVPALWKSKAPAAIIPEWVQPTGAHDAYNKGYRVLFEGQVYESLIDNNTWSPTAYPQGWLQVN